jgi:hypothetical protein
MANPIMVPDPFAPSNQDVPTAQQQLQRAVEEATVAAVMPFEREKQLVNRDHVAMQRKLWGLQDDHFRPLEISTDGRKA